MVVLRGCVINMQMMELCATELCCTHMCRSTSSNISNCLQRIKVNMSSTIAPNPLRAAQLSRRSRCAQSRMVIVASSNKQVTLLDYGAGNVCSVRNAIKKLGYTIKDVRLAAC